MSERSTSLRIAQTVRADGDDWWKWSVWIDGASDELARVQSVTWRLHPTFPKPVVESRDRRTRFRIHREGWGEFRIRADLHFDDGDAALSHMLRLVEGSDSEAPAAEDASPRVYLSYALGDRDVGESIRSILRSQGLSVMEAMDVAAGESWADALQSKIAGADVVVGVTSPGGSPWIDEEIRFAAARNKRVLAVHLENPRTQAVRATEAHPDTTSIQVVRGSRSEGSGLSERIAADVARIVGRGGAGA